MRAAQSHAQAFHLTPSGPGYPGRGYRIR
eukprot:COSAG01_NODE_31777_length_591_cov_3.623984_1_plen_28_part_01